MSETYGSTDSPKTIAAMGRGMGGGPPGGPSDLPDNLKRISTANLTKSAIAVIGDFWAGSGENVDNVNGYKQGYIGYAREHGYSHFALGQVLGKSLFRDNEPLAEAANNYYLDQVIARRNIVEIYREPEKTDESRWLGKEIKYLEDRGYQRSGNRMLPPGHR